MTAQEILNVISQNMTESEFAFDDCDYEQLGLGNVKEVDQHGGEGEGDSWWSVKHFIDHGVYIRIDGSYASYDGTSFDDGYGREVRPQEKVITVYE